MSGIDLSQFHQVFFEESFEGLDVMENGLLGLDIGNVDNETINDIFRAAHSIKGGGGTFGFSSVSDFTHVVETLLDEIRAGQRAITREYVDLFLSSVDCLRTMLTELQDGQEPDLTGPNKLKEKFEAVLETPSQTSVEPDAEPTTEGGSEKVNDSKGWAITFIPGADICRTGNEPYRIINELEGLGELTTQCHVDSIPDYDAMEPEQMFLYWHFKLISDCSLEDVKSPFDWVEDESELTFTPLSEESVQLDEQEPTSDAQFAAQEMTTQAQPEPIQVQADDAQTQKESLSPQAPVAAQKKTVKPESQSIRVGIDKVDSLINMVGELVITQSMLGQLGRDFHMDRLHRLQEGLTQLEHHTRELQESVMRIRMLPISFSFSRFPRLVRDLSSKLGKKVDLVLLGENTELDKTVMEKIGDPLVHMVRNSLDHGLETPEKRKASGKSEVGTLTLNAYHHGGNIIIEIIDDGAGINEEKILSKAIENGLVAPTDSLTPEQVQDLIFHPGFSTADEISDVSGRGVGMDVVRRNIQALNGSVEVHSVPGEGSTFKIRLPLTLAILDGQLVRVGPETYILPLVSIVESIQIDPTLVNSVGGGFEVYRLRNEYVPIIRLFDVMNVEPDSQTLSDGLLVVVEGENKKVGFVIDDLLAQQQVVIKSLESNYKKVEGISGATILGDGTVALILDITGLIQVAGIKASTLNQLKELEKSAQGDEAA